MNVTCHVFIASIPPEAQMPCEPRFYVRYRIRLQQPHGEVHTTAVSHILEKEDLLFDP
jgi:hypothetical protein